MSHIVIIGNGVAGITAARNIRKRSDHRVTVISSESEHFYSRPALMYIYMGHMEYAHTKPYEDWFWKKNRIELLHAHVKNVDVESKRLELSSGDVCEYDSLVFATGAEARRAGWTGQHLDGVQTFTNLGDLQLLQQNSLGVQQAVIVGGGLIGVEVAEMLRSRGIHVTMLVREDRYSGTVLPSKESAMVHTELVKHGIHALYNTELKEIHDDGGDTGRRVSSVTTAENQQIPCQLVVLCAGVQPRIDLAKAAGIPTRTGVLVDEFFATSIPDVYAIGDCAERPLDKVDLLWYTARAHAEALAKTLCGERTVYDSGIFYNSAKFFDLEYQTYGVVPANLEGMESWTMFTRGGKGFLRITHDKNGVVGFNAMGIRLRSDVCMNLIRRHASIHDVVKNIDSIQFDEEFTSALSRSASHRATSSRGSSTKASVGMS